MRSPSCVPTTDPSTSSSGFERAGDDAFVPKRALVDRIIRELSVHAQIEEQIFYPVDRAAEVPQGVDIVLESLEEHLVAKGMLADLEEMDPTMSASTPRSPSSSR